MQFSNECNRVQFLKNEEKFTYWCNLKIFEIKAYNIANSNDWINMDYFVLKFNKFFIIIYTSDFSGL